MPTRFRTPFPMLTCTRFTDTLDFYRDQLGFRPTYQFPPEGDPVFVVLELDGAMLGLGTADQAPIHGRAVTPRSGHVFELCIYADDVDAAVAELRAAGVTVLVEPRDQPWGERMAYVSDPEDNPVMIATTTDEG